MNHSPPGKFSEPRLLRCACRTGLCDWPGGRASANASAGEATSPMLRVAASWLADGGYVVVSNH